MSKVFITKNGQFVSRGEGVLTRIENPDLEVNDIGVEVSERIAEDVQEGDLVFRAQADVDRLHTLDADEGKGVFFTKDDELFLYKSGVTPHILKYENEKWIPWLGFDSKEIDFVDRSSQTASQPTIFQHSDGDVYITDDFASVNIPPFRRYQKLDGRSISYIDPWKGNCPIEFSSTNQPRVNICPDAFFETSSGVVHYVLPYGDVVGNNLDISGRYFFTGIFDKTTETITETSHDTSGVKNVLGAGFYEVDSDLFMVTQSQRWADSSGVFHDAGLFKWNTSSNNWDFVELIKTGLTANEGGGPADNHLRVFKANNETYISVTRINTQLDQRRWYHHDKTLGRLVLIDRGDPPTYQWSTWADYELSGKNYYINFSRSDVPGYPAASAGYFETLVFDPATSSTTNLGMEFNKFEFYHASSYTNSMIPSIIQHKGDIHLYLYKSSENGTNHILKYDYATSTFKNNFVNKAPTNSLQADDLDEIDFSGTSIVAWGGANRIKFSKYEPSSEAFIPIELDINTSWLGPGVKLYNHDGILYMIGSRLYGSPRGLVRYQYDPSANIFYKLEELDSSAQPYATPYSIAFEDHDGSSFLATSHRYTDGSPHISVFIVDGSSIVSATSPPDSSSPNNTNGYDQMDMLSIGGKLHLVRATYENATGSGINAYSWNGSGWDVEPWNYGTGAFNYTISRRENNIRLFDVSGTAYALHTSDNWPRYMLHKYETSSWEPVKNESIKMSPYDYPSQLGLKHAEKDGTHYFAVPHYTLGHTTAFASLFVRSPNGRWAKYSVNTDGYSQNQCQIYANQYGVYMAVNSSNAPISTWFFKVSDYLGETVWYKTPFNLSRTKPISSYGIALQDGSKGDIIKIRRIKQ